ncbi:MAG TPA: hypothetical protein VF713_18335 [Thermoanaerobaculia bacterium]
MIVYVETNFLIELAYLQERCDSCELILDFAKAGAITLALPAFSAAEARFTLQRRAAERQTFQKSLSKHIREISRSEPFRGLGVQSKDVITALVAGEQEARHRLEAAVQAVEERGITIPLTGEVLRLARWHELNLSLSSQDALVLASVKFVSNFTDAVGYIKNALRPPK